VLGLLFILFLVQQSIQKKIIKGFLNRVYKPVVRNYLSRERNYSYEGIKLKIFPGVFHPGIFFSTKNLIGYLEKYNLQNKSLLELGAGSGLISIVASKKGAHVVSVDISKKAIENISINNKLNQVQTNLVHSNLFDNIPKQIFDFIIINPPYYKGNHENEASYAWYAGDNFQYFEKLFQQLPAYMNGDSRTIMILSDDCDIRQIESIAEKNKFKFHLSFSKKMFMEINFIFEIRHQADL
jgi:release factor glutamine methyltransferase